MIRLRVMRWYKNMIFSALSFTADLPLGSLKEWCLNWLSDRYIAAAKRAELQLYKRGCR